MPSIISVIQQLSPLERAVLESRIRQNLPAGIFHLGFSKAYTTSGVSADCVTFRNHFSAAPGWEALGRWAHSHSLELDIIVHHGGGSCERAFVSDFVYPTAMELRRFGHLSAIAENNALPGYVHFRPAKLFQNNV